MTLPQELTHTLFGEEGGAKELQVTKVSLTPRELDVLYCIALGMSNKQIAQNLFISTTTVRSHVSSMIRKLNVENRTQLAIYPREHDLI